MPTPTVTIYDSRRLMELPLLNYEREQHDSVNDVADYWVNLPVLLSTAPTQFYVYYRPQTTADGANPTNVWDSNYVFVYHLKESTGFGIRLRFHSQQATLPHRSARSE